MTQLETKPFDKGELQKCSDCGRGMMHNDQIHFYEVVVGQCIVDVQAVRQQHALDVVFPGAPALATVFAPTTNVAHRLPPKRHLFCSDCAMKPVHPILLLED